jgi:hypothetical protein
MHALKAAWQRRALGLDTEEAEKLHPAEELAQAPDIGSWYAVDARNYIRAAPIDELEALAESENKRADGARYTVLRELRKRGEE